MKGKSFLYAYLCQVNANFMNNSVNSKATRKDVLKKAVLAILIELTCDSKN